MNRGSAAAGRASRRSRFIRGVQSRCPKLWKRSRTADLITLGPGSLFTSVIPNLLVDGIPQAIAQSRALKAYFVNLMSQPGETTNFRASDHVGRFFATPKTADSGRVRGQFACDSRGKCWTVIRRSAARPVENDMENLERMGLKVIAEDLLRMSGKRVQEKIRHDSSVIGAIAIELAQKGHKKETETEMNHTVVILAAGLGTRMRSKRAKVLHRAGGLALVEQVVAAARTLAPYGRIVVVTGHQAELVEELLQPLGIGFVRQDGQKGTGHALASCRDAVPHDGLLTVLYGDTPLLTAATLGRLRDTQTDSGAAATLITTTLEDPTGYGRILLNDKATLRNRRRESAARRSSGRSS